MSAFYGVVLAEPEQRLRGATTREPALGAAHYEPGHSERQVSGSVAVGRESRWLATLAIPMTGDQSALLTIERDGPTPPGAPIVTEAALVIPPGEADALLTLLRGIIAQARRDGVLAGRTYP